MLQSLVETQLHAYAARLQQEHHLELSVNDLVGRGVTPAKNYIIKVAEVDIKNDPGWQKLADLQELRNIIVHQRGRQGDSRFHQASVQRLLKKYADLSLTTSFFQGLSRGLHQDLMTTFPLCSHFLEEIEAFFKRLCKAAGFQDRAWNNP